ncbi:MAG: zinc carboxypeptidase [Bacteroidales bacterium]|nr:zinc carboxypeptidase [Bacteroidales bacterium]
MRILSITLLAMAMLFTIPNCHAGQALSYYLPEGDYDPTIQTPEAFFGFQAGAWHLDHGQLLSYIQYLSKASDRAVLIEYGRSHEQRPLIHLVITLPANHQNLESIRQQHLSLSDPNVSKELDIEGMPVIVRLGYGVHGNEASAHNAAPLVAYYLVASQSLEVREMLEDMVVLLDPSLNPDGQDRFASWVNRHRSKVLNPDPAGREFSDIWPGSRSNHYWFDLNRDWLPVQQPESRGRVREFHRWKPNVNTDHHEFGGNSTFYFQPGVPSRGNPLTPKRTDELTMEIAHYHARAFDQAGQLYYTKEDFDDYYYGKGSSYPDVNGSIGILFEQASTRGHRVETVHGIIDFSLPIRNQVLVSLSSMEAAADLRLELLEHQREFYRSALQEANQFPVKAYVFGDPYDQGRNQFFLDILFRHQVELYEIKEGFSLGGHHYEPGNAWLVPLEQPQYRMIRSLFESVLEYGDSLFYDVSTWTLPLAFNMPYGEISRSAQLAGLKGEALKAVPVQDGLVKGGKSDYAYLFSWDDYRAPKALYLLQQQGIRAKVATRPFTIEAEGAPVEFSYGSIMIPVQNQDVEAGKIFELIGQAAKASGLTVYAAGKGLTLEGINLGSSAFNSLPKPSVLMLVGQGVNSREAGEVWHLLDQRLEMPVTMVETDRINSLDLSRYNTLVMVSGSYGSINVSGRESLDRWLRAGGILVALGNASNWLGNNGFVKIEFKKTPVAEDTLMVPYASRSQYLGARRNPGSIFRGRLDITHPIGYGFHREEVPVFIAGNTFAKPDSSAFANPLIFEEDNLMSGYIFEPYRPMIENAAGILVNSRGRGNIISFMDNPNSRGFWFGTNRLFMNALFFGPIIRR